MARLRRLLGAALVVAVATASAASRRPIAASHNNRPIAVVTAVDARFYAPLLTVLNEILPHSNLRVIVYDLGLLPAQRAQLDCVSRAGTATGADASTSRRLVHEVRSFPFDEEPAHVRKLNCYAWKPIIVQAVVREFGRAVWIDSGVMLVGLHPPHRHQPTPITASGAGKALLTGLLGGGGGGGGGTEATSDSDVYFASAVAAAAHAGGGGVLSDQTTHTMRLLSNDYYNLHGHLRLVLASA